jgi:hypothetical protein
MQITDVNEYKCVVGELVQIRFFCTPHRENVRIRRSFDGNHFDDITTNSIQFVMGSNRIVLTIQYAFLLTGSCLNQILVVDNSPTKDDRVMANAVGADTDLQNFIFNI